ncbi:MAG TPA: hypothetical protein VGB16_03090 [candidate division Zixibacteria bacterium]
MSTQTVSPEVIPKKTNAFKSLTNWFNHSFSTYEIEPKDKTKFKLIDKRDKEFVREVSKNQIARLRRRINQVS